ncbi:MAG: hypothetical protein M3Q55_15935 [Acidobacteriota bacterium]|nr:hypothetical protein [Acidobacteriota bacterium]
MRTALCSAVLVTAIGFAPTRLHSQAADAADAAITAKIAEVNQRLQAVPDAQGLREACAGNLAAAGRAAAAHRTYVALGALRRCLTYVGSLEVLAASQAGIGTDLAAFRKAWERAGVELHARRAALGDAPGTRMPLAVRGMIESELLTFETYYQSALLYGENTTVESGLLYLGFPYGVLDFVSFAASLPLPAPAPAPAIPDLGGAMFALDGELLDFYKAQTTPEMRGALAGTNSLFKVVQDLHAARMTAGTFFEYLRTVESFTANRVRAVEPADAATLRARLASGVPRAADVDQTIAGYFVERAAGLLSDAEPSVDQRRAAAVILDAVLPAYDRALRGEIPAASVPASASATPVTVTLVRWPYT